MKWLRVTRKHPCFVCKKHDYCTYRASDDAACCMRVESADALKNGGWLHKTGDTPTLRVPVQVRRTRADVQPAAAPIDCPALHSRFRASLNGHMGIFAHELGVQRWALERLECGFDGEAYTFPMRNAKREIVGFRRRKESGTWTFDGRNVNKLSVRGGHEGVFLPDGCPERDMVLIPEGPTDTAAALSIGFEAIGRPNNLGARAIVASFLKSMKCVVVTDNDKGGLTGAKALIADLLPVAAWVKMIRPPMGYKDLRAWVNGGAEYKDVNRMITNAGIIA